jgi:SAM-dependent methyltransferase
MNNCEELKECLCCGQTHLETILDLNDQPLANSYHKGDKLPVFPLKLNLCDNCWHLQLSHGVNKDLMFKNYLYVSGTSNTLREYFDWFSRLVLKYNPSMGNVLDIACNDGSQLDSFTKLGKGIKTYGIDPAINLSHLSQNKGHEVIVDYFNTESVKLLSENKFDVIIAQNVFAHNTYPLEFLKICKGLLNKNGHIFIQTSQSDMVVNNEFDTIYHEHISFFSVSSMKKIVERSGLVLNDIFKSHIHGNSFVFVISNNDVVYEGIEKMYNDFINTQLNDIETYKRYSKMVSTVTKELHDSINTYKNKGYQIIGYGAAAKGNTLLNFGKIKLDFIVDDNELKWDLLTPGMDIPIKNPKSILDIDRNQPILFIPLAWNFYKEIKSKIKTIRDNENDLFIRYFPKLNEEK